jgi:biopolymer transport protein TolR
MAFSVGRKKRGLMTEINMVPFIDVVLVLLIIFMVVSPFLAQSEMPIRLPRALSGQPTQGDDPLKVRVAAGGDVFLGAERVIRTELEGKLKSALAARPGLPVLIEADRDVSFKNVVFALDAAERAGAVKVGVAVENPAEDPAVP